MILVWEAAPQWGMKELSRKAAPRKLLGVSQVRLCNRSDLKNNATVQSVLHFIPSDKLAHLFNLNFQQHRIGDVAIIVLIP